MSARLVYHDAVAARGGEAPLHPAVYEGSHATNYAQLWAAAGGVAAALRARQIGSENVVAVASAGSAAYLAVILGALACGAVVAPLNTRLTTQELVAYCEPLSPHLFVCDEPHEQVASELCVGDAQVVVLPAGMSGRPLSERLRGLWEPGCFAAHIDEDQPAIVFPTGGTTGTPKAAFASHRTLWLLAASLAPSSQRNANDRALYYLPFFHLTLVTGPLTTLFAGAAVDLLGGFDVSAVMDRIERGITVLQHAPTGRLKGMIVSGSENVSPVEVESALAAIPRSPKSPSMAQPMMSGASASRPPSYFEMVKRSRSRRYAGSLPEPGLLQAPKGDHHRRRDSAHHAQQAGSRCAADRGRGPCPACHFIPKGPIVVNRKLRNPLTPRYPR